MPGTSSCFGPLPSRMGSASRGSASSISVTLPASPTNMLLRHSSSAPHLDTEADRRTLAFARKQRQLDALRESDQQRFRLRIENDKKMRDYRLSRSMATLVSPDSIAAQVSRDLRSVDCDEARRRQTKHGDWQQAVFRPVELGLDEHFNGPSRAELQQLGMPRRVDFNMLSPKAFKLRSTVHRDPLKRELLQREKEMKFDREANEVLLGRSQSSPELLRDSLAAASHALPKARHRTVLEATEWNPIRLPAHGVPAGGTCCRALASAPPEQDGVPSAGKRTVRTGANRVSHGDLGLLGGQSGGVVLNEAMKHRTSWGCSSGAPVQDHFNFPRSEEAAAVEMPLGKRVFPGLLC